MLPVQLVCLFELGKLLLDTVYTNTHECLGRTSSTKSIVRKPEYEERKGGGMNKEEIAARWFGVTFDTKNKKAG